MGKKWIYFLSVVIKLWIFNMLAISNIFLCKETLNLKNQRKVGKYFQTFFQNINLGITHYSHSKLTEFSSFFPFNYLEFEDDFFDFERLDLLLLDSFLLFFLSFSFLIFFDLERDLEELSSFRLFGHLFAIWPFSLQLKQRRLSFSFWNWSLLFLTNLLVDFTAYSTSSFFPENL